MKSSIYNKRGLNMNTEIPNSPLYGDVPTSVVLKNAPLKGVIFQVRFPRIAKIFDEQFIADFQEQIRPDYPNFHREIVSGVDVNIVGDKIQQMDRSDVIWRFFDASDIFRISLFADSISIETTEYTTRADLLEKFEVILGFLNSTISPNFATRLGVRYVNQISDPKIMLGLDKMFTTRVT